MSRGRGGVYDDFREMVEGMTAWLTRWTFFYKWNERGRGGDRRQPDRPGADLECEVHRTGAESSFSKGRRRAKEAASVGGLSGLWVWFAGLGVSGGANPVFAMSSSAGADLRVWAWASAGEIFPDQPIRSRRTTVLLVSAGWSHMSGRWPERRVEKPCPCPDILHQAIGTKSTASSSAASTSHVQAKNDRADARPSKSL